jgi:TonB family protein
MPQFPGGEEKLFEFIKDNLKYPESAIKNNIQGKVVLRFIVNADGSIENIQVVRSVSSECDQEAIRVVKKFPRFSKPLQNGKPTSVWFTLPIQFKLNTNQKTTNIYDVVDQMPQFPGGDNELFKFIAENLKGETPFGLCYVEIQGRVICRFVVEKDGSIGQVEVVRSLDPPMDKEAVRLIKSMPKWIPGKQNGKVVRVYFTLPINFKSF